MHILANIVFLFSKAHAKSVLESKESTAKFRHHEKLNVPGKQGDRGSTVVKALYYKSEGRWFDPSWCHLNFSLT